MRGAAHPRPGPLLARPAGVAERDGDRRTRGGAGGKARRIVAGAGLRRRPPLPGGGGGRGWGAPAPRAQCPARGGIRPTRPSRMCHSATLQSHGAPCARGGPVPISRRTAPAAGPGDMRRRRYVQYTLFPPRAPQGPGAGGPGAPAPSSSTRHCPRYSFDTPPPPAAPPPAAPPPPSAATLARDQLRRSASASADTSSSCAVRRRRRARGVRPHVAAQARPSGPGPVPPERSSEGGGGKEGGAP